MIHSAFRLSSTYLYLRSISSSISGLVARLTASRRTRGYDTILVKASIYKMISKDPQTARGGTARRVKGPCTKDVRAEEASRKNHKKTRIPFRSFQSITFPFGTPLYSYGGCTGCTGMPKRVLDSANQSFAPWDMPDDSALVKCTKNR